MAAEADLWGPGGRQLVLDSDLSGDPVHITARRHAMLITPEVLYFPASLADTTKAEQGGLGS